MMIRPDLMLRIFFFIVLSAAAAAAWGHGAERHAGLTKHFNGSLFAVTQKGLYSIELIWDDSEYPLGRDVVGIVLHDSRDQDVENGKLDVRVVKSDGATQRIECQEKGHGLYLIPKTAFPVEGIWSLAISVAVGGTAADSVSFAYPADWTRQRLPKGQHPREEIRKAR